MQKVKDNLSALRATLTADGPDGRKVKVAIQNNVPGKIYINVGGKEAWIQMNEFTAVLAKLYGTGQQPKHARKDKDGAL